jgi:hypothetical protein
LIRWDASSFIGVGSNRGAKLVCLLPELFSRRNSWTPSHV